MTPFEIALGLSIPIFGAYILYGAIHWLIGTPQHRQEAMAIWHEAIEAAVLFAISWFIPSIGMWFAYQLQSMYPPQYWQLPAVDLWSALWQGPAVRGLENASRVFFDVADKAVGDMATVTNLIVGTGATPFTQMLSMALSQISGVLYSAASRTAYASWLAGYTAKLAEALLGAYPVLALALATGRRLLASLGAGLMAFAAVASAAMPVAATAIVAAQAGYSYNFPFIAAPGGAEIARSPLYAQVFAIYVMMAGVMGAATMALAYALSGMPHALEVPL